MTTLNAGDAPACPLWTIDGPVTFIDITVNGESLHWTGDEPDGVVIDTEKDRIRSTSGANLFSGLAPLPRFAHFVQGDNEVAVSTDGTATVTWRPGKVVIG